MNPPSDFWTDPDVKAAALGASARLAEIGDRVAGTVVELGKRESRYGGHYPVVSLESDDTVTALHASTKMLHQALSELQPVIGDFLDVEMVGTDPAFNDMRLYRIEFKPKGSRTRPVVVIDQALNGDGSDEEPF